MDGPALDQSSNPAADISWMMLDRFVFTYDPANASRFDLFEFMGGRNFGSSRTSLGEYLAVGLLPAVPPTVSRLYVELDIGEDNKAVEVVTADRGIFLLRVTTSTVFDIVPYRQDYFVFRAATISLLKRLPTCNEPIVLPLGGSKISMTKRLFHNNTLALVSDISNDEVFGFVVVQLAKFVDMPGGSPKKGAEICLFRCSKCDVSSAEDEGMWETLTLPILHKEEEFSDLQGWSTDGAIRFNDFICWFDYYHGGILLYNLGHGFMEYARLPISNRPINSLPSEKHLEMYRSLCVTGQRGNQLLRFVDVARDDHKFYGPLGNGYTFTITCHTFGPVTTLGQRWYKDAVVTSRELYLDGRECLMPRNSVPTFPLVSRDEPHLVHFLVSEPRDEIDKVSVLVIDISKQTVVSVTPYIRGDEDLCGSDAIMVRHRSRLPWSFLPFQF